MKIVHSVWLKVQMPVFLAYQTTIIKMELAWILARLTITKK
jgi:hypothetical protein